MGTVPRTDHQQMQSFVLQVDDKLVSQIWQLLI